MVSRLGLKALAVLEEGGSFVSRLEGGRFGEVWKYRLLGKGGGVIKGVGFKTFHELKAAGKLKLAGGGTSVSTYYTLAEEIVS